MDWKSITNGIVGSVITAMLIGGGGYVANLASSGALVRMLGGMTEAQVSEYIEKHRPTNVMPSDDLKLELVAGNTSWSIKNADGSFVALVEPSSCPAGAVLINAYCGINDEGTHGATGNLQRVGLGPNDTFYCTWNGVNKPDSFQGHASPVCLRIAKK